MRRLFGTQVPKSSTPNSMESSVEALYMYTTITTAWVVPQQWSQTLNGASSTKDSLCQYKIVVLMAWISQIYQSHGLLLISLCHFDVILADFPNLHKKSLKACFGKVVMIYRIVNFLVDIPANKHLVNAQNRNRGHETRFLQPFTRVRAIVFSPSAIRIWNTLPSDVMG